MYYILEMEDSENINGEPVSMYKYKSYGIYGIEDRILSYKFHELKNKYSENDKRVLEAWNSFNYSHIEDGATQLSDVRGVQIFSPEAIELFFNFKGDVSKIEKSNPNNNRKEEESTNTSCVFYSTVEGVYLAHLFTYQTFLEKPNDGTDYFFIQRAYLVVSERFKVEWIRRGLTGATFVPIEPKDFGNYNY